MSQLLSNRRALVRRPDQPQAPPVGTTQRDRAGRRHPREWIDHWGEAPPLRLDEDRRGDPQHLAEYRSKISGGATPSWEQISIFGDARQLLQTQASRPLYLWPTEDSHHLNLHLATGIYHDHSIL
jgi:hypothetical protein